MKIMFLIRSMGVGGTERQVCVLCRELLRRGHDVSVLLYYGGGPLEGELRELGTRVVDLKKRGRWRNLDFLTRLAGAVRSGQPDVLYAMLPLSNLLALALRGVCDCAIACGVRASSLKQARDEWLTRLAAQLERRLVRYADVVIVNSQVGAEHLRGSRRRDGNVTVIDNGIDAQAFSFNEDGRRRMRKSWGVPDGTAVVGCVARLDPMKDHATLLRGFALLRRSRPHTYLVCVGFGTQHHAAKLRALAGELQLQNAIRWIEREPRMSELYSGFDALCLSSAYGEGFPNVLAEAMLCGVPCVATDIGDAGRILSSADYLVPAADPQSLAQALGSALGQGRARSAERAEKIRREFSPQLLAERTEIALREAIERRSSRRVAAGQPQRPREGP